MSNKGRKLGKPLAACVVLSLLATAPLSAGYVINIYPVSDYSTNTGLMNTTLGISGDTIDDFETTTLTAGLTITMSGGVTTTTLSSLPALLNANAYSPSVGDNWDGPSVLINNPYNQLTSVTNPSNIASLITFNYAAGTTQFGVGLSNFQSPDSPVYPITDHDLYINGVDQGSLESLAGANWTPGLGQNGFLVITATNGSSITSMGLQDDNTTVINDVMVFDHLAINTGAASVAPEPASFLLLPVGAGLLYRVLRRHARR